MNPAIERVQAALASVQDALAGVVLCADSLAENQTEVDSMLHMITHSREWQPPPIPEALLDRDGVWDATPEDVYEALALAKAAWREAHNRDIAGAVEFTTVGGYLRKMREGCVDRTRFAELLDVEAFNALALDWPITSAC